MEELREAVSENKADDTILDSPKLTASSICSKLDLEENHLLYLERCIMEATRLDPPVPLS